MRTVTKTVKGLKLKINGRSADYISPSFIWGCAGGCLFCYVYRHNSDMIYVANNIDEILESIDIQSKKFPDKIPNQCGDRWIIDISCNTDIGLHWKQLDWIKIFNFFKHHPTLSATFATKYVRDEIVEYQAKNLRMRYSMLPEEQSKILFPKLSDVKSKVTAANKAVDNGWEIHWNFSPVIYKSKYLHEYKELFQYINKHSSEALKKQVKAEVIFLRHHRGLHERNIDNPGEVLLWNRFLQTENKSGIITYDMRIRPTMLRHFKQLLRQELPYCSIRYEF